MSTVIHPRFYFAFLQSCSKVSRKESIGPDTAVFETTRDVAIWELTSYKLQGSFENLQVTRVIRDDARN